MACSSQSASEYIKNARDDLVGQLTSLSVILENLYQQNVLIEEEVSDIEAKIHDFSRTRAILDSVTKKGEEACYRLLRILYETRSRTLPVPHLKNKHSASTKAKRSDLRHWISCFPFKDDDSIYVDYIKGSKPCNRYQAKLKSEARTLSNDIWRGSENLFEENKKPGLSYYSLVLNTEGTTTPSKVKTFKNKKSNMCRSKKLRTYIPESKPEISPSDLLKHDKNILLVGKPGMGKTALSHEMLRLWSERDNTDLDYMFYFDMRELTNIPPTMSLEDLLFNVYCEPDGGKDEVLADMMSHSDNLIIILDGVTDFTSLIVKKLKKNLPYAKIIITCRPEDEDNCRPEDEDKKDSSPKDWLRVEVKGFSEETISRYLSSVLGENHRKVLSNVELLTLCHVPMYALMVAASFSSEDSLQPRTVSEIYINIVRFCLQMNSNKIKMKNLNQFIKTKSNEILSLAEAAFNATERKTVNLEELSCEDGCVLSFLKTLDVKVAPTEIITLYAFLHYTMQEFFAALWLLKNPDKIREVLQQFLTEEKKHMKHLIPFMCRLLNEKKPSLMICLTPAEELKETQQRVTKDLIDTVLSHGSELHVDMLFLCQCLYESQSSESCISFLDKLNYHLDLSGKNLDPHSCCAVSYVISQSTDRKINVNLKDVTISAQGMRQLHGCLQNVERTGAFQQQLWKIVLLSEGQIDNQSLQMDYEALLHLDGNQIHLPVRGEKQLFERAVRVMQKAPTKVDVCLYQHLWAPRLRGLHEYLVEVLSNINSIRFVFLTSNISEENRFLVNLFCAAAEKEQQTGQKMVKLVASVWRFSSFYPSNPFKEDRNRTDFLLRLFSQLKDRETQTGLSLLPSLQSVFQSALKVWIINLSERKTSILLEVMKLQTEKKPVMVTNCSHGESEVRIFLQCLPHISHLWFDLRSSGFGERVRFLVNLFCAAAKREQQTGKRILEMLASVSRYETFPSKERCMDDKYYDYNDDDYEDYDDYDEDYVAEDQSNFLLDLYSQLKDRETQTGLSLLPSLQSVFQSTSPVWFINLSERKTSILLEVMKLQPEKKPVNLTDCSQEESEVEIFLQCLPHISQLRFYLWNIDSEKQTRFLLNLFCAAVQRQQQSGEMVVETLASVFSNGVPVNERDIYDMDEYPDDEYQSDFLLRLYSQMKDCETQTGLSLLPTLQPVFQSAPEVWIINLSERKTSILLEVMKLQTEKKPVNLTFCSQEESEVRIFLQCLPHISQLCFSPWGSAAPEQIKFLANLFCAAAERETQTGEKMLQMLASVCSYETFPLYNRYIRYYFSDKYNYLDDEYEDEDEDDEADHQNDFLLDLYSQMKDRETQTGLSLLPSLQSVFQSAPKVWFINLSKIKTSILLEVMKLQPEKKPVKLKRCSQEESEVRIFLQYLPHISQLSLKVKKCMFSEQIKFLVNLFCAAAEREKQTREEMLQMLASVCRYETFPLNEHYTDYNDQSNFLLDLYSQLKDIETQTGLSLLQTLQSVFLQIPPIWFINLSKIKTSILMEVMKLQPEKKPVMVTNSSQEESEVGIFLQCLPHISQLSFSFSLNPWTSAQSEQIKFLVNLFCAAAERETQTGEKMLQMLASVCRYETFPLNKRDDHFELFSTQTQTDFLLDLYSQMKDRETQTGLSLLPSLQSVFQSAPKVWIINFSERKTSILLEVMKLQPEKKPVKLTHWSKDQSEVRIFLQCLPHISQLSCDSGFFQSICSFLSEESREEVQQLESLLQLLDFKLILSGVLTSGTCSSVGRVLHLSGPKVDLSLTGSQMSVEAAAVLFSSTAQLQSLRVCSRLVLFLGQWVSRGRLTQSLVIKELSVVSTKPQPSQRVLLKVGSSLASLLRFWKVGQLDLTESGLPAQSLFSLLLHDAPLTLRLSEERLQQLLVLLQEIQDQNLMSTLLSKVGGDLSSCTLSWELLHYLLQQPTAQTITVDLKKNRFLEERVDQLLPFLHRVEIQRPSPGLVRMSIRQICRDHSSHLIPGLLRSLGHVINLNCTQLDSEDCDALLFILRHSDGVKLKLLWSSMPAGGVQSVLCLLHTVSDLSLDRNLLLRFILCCAASDSQQGAAPELLRTLQHRLDLSSRCCVDLSEEDRTGPVSLTAADCRAVSTVLRHSSRDTQLDLRHCELEDSVLDLLFPVLDRVRLRVSKTVLVQLLSLLVDSQGDTERRAMSLCRALGGELDLSHSPVDERLCGALVLVLDWSEGLTELDLSHCQLTDQLLLQLSTQLHKVQVLDLSHNHITDASTAALLQLVSINASIGSVRLSNNNIGNKTPYKDNRKFEI